MRNRLSARLRIRFLTAFAAVLAGLAILPAASQALVLAGNGIAAAGTVVGTWQAGYSSFTGQSQVVQFAGVENCFSAFGSTFVATFTDPAGNQDQVSFNSTDNQYQASCSDFDPNPQILTFSNMLASFNSSPFSASVSDGEYDGPNADDGTPDTVQFTLNTPLGDIFITKQTPGPLQGAPGRVQPFGPGLPTL